MSGKPLGHRARNAGRRVAVLLCALAIASPGMTEEDPKAPEPLETPLMGIQKAMINASAKLKNDIIGMRSEYPNAPATPAGECCAKNLMRIEQRIGTAYRILEAFDRCYAAEDNQDMLIAVRLAKSDLAAFARTVPQFAQAPTKSQARGGLNSMTRTYNLLRETAAALTPCEGMEIEVEAYEATGTSSGDGRDGPSGQN
jgi:hypothetical protein